MNPMLLDVHTHVQFQAFKDDQDAVIKRALDAGVWMVNVGTQKDTSAKAVETAQKYPEGVYATVGLHPIHTEKSYHDPQELGESREAQGFTSRGEEFDYDYYRKLAEDPKVVAIGECGLDYYRLGPETKNRQQENFVKQIELAVEIKKPLMIHCRQAFWDLIGILKVSSFSDKVESPRQSRDKFQVSGVVHFFTGTKEDARKLLDMGFSFSFGGVITFVPKSPKATGIPAAMSGLGTRDYDEVIKYIPLDRIVLETDAPYVAPVPYRGKRNEPAYIIEVAKMLAELRGVSLEEVAERTTVNSRKLFGV